MPSYKLWKVTRQLCLEEGDKIATVIRTDTAVIGGSREQEVCEEARRSMSHIEARYEARQLTDAEYTAHYAGEDYEEPKTRH